MPASRLRRFPTWFFPALALLALAAVAGLLWLPSADSAQAQAGQTVPADWPLIPDGIEPGDRFRLLFVTSATRDASSSDIVDYNAHVRVAAGGNADLQAFRSQFTALISTSDMDARDNTGTTGGGVPIHWLGGAKVADDYADLYDGDWDSVSGKTEGGGGYTGLVWTGGNKAGEKSGQRYAGADEVRLGDLGDATMPLSSPTSKASREAYPLYALSPVITVAEPEPEPTPTPTPQPDEPEPESAPAIASGPVIVSSPASGDAYVKGETIEVSVTFSESVTVTGQPYLRLAVGERGRRARYDGGGGGATLVFAYEVKGNDADSDGISIEANRLKLNDGSIEDADGNAASLEHSALADQSGHKVNGSPEEDPNEGEEQRTANAAPSFAADADTRSVAENVAAGTSVGGPVTASDADGDALTYVLTGADANAFAIDAVGQITVNGALDYETKTSYSVTVTVSDGRNAAGEADAGVDDSIAVTISVTNVDEPGVVSLSADAPGAGSAVTGELLDPDGGVSSVAWTWERSAEGTTWTSIDGATGDAYTPTEDDVGHYLRATAAYTDREGSGKTASGATTNTVRTASTDPFADKWNNVPPQPWFHENYQPYSCSVESKTTSPWIAAGMMDLGGSDELSLIRYYGNGRYLRYGEMQNDGCTPTTKYPNIPHRDAPVDPTYYSLGDTDIFVDIVRMLQGGGLTVNSTMKQAVDLLNARVAPYYRRVSGDRFRITFKAGNEITVKGSSYSDATVEAIGKAAPCYVGAGDTPNCRQYGNPGGLNRIVFFDGAQWGWGHGDMGYVRMHLREIGLSSQSGIKTIIHEIGHAFMDWAHSPTQINGIPLDQTSNHLAIMSGLVPWDGEIPAPLAIYRYSAGWIPVSEVALHTTDSATYTLSKPLDDAHAGNQLLVIHSGRTGAFTTLEVLPERPTNYKNPFAKIDVYDHSNPKKRRPFRYNGVLVSRYDQTGGTGGGARFGPALHDTRNPNAYANAGAGKDDYSVIVDGGTRHIGGGVMVTVSQNADGSYQVAVSGGKIAEFQPWCWGIIGKNEFDTPCSWNWNKPITPDNSSDVLVTKVRNTKKPSRQSANPEQVFATKWNDVTAQPWFKSSEDYSCAAENKTTSPWIDAGMEDLGGSDPLSLIRFYGKGTYLRYSNMMNEGCTRQTKDSDRYHKDPPIDPAYFSVGDLDIYVDIARVRKDVRGGGPIQAGWIPDDKPYWRTQMTMDEAVKTLNDNVAPYFNRVSGGKLNLTFKAGVEFQNVSSVGDGRSKFLAAAAPCYVSATDSCHEHGYPGGLNRILFSDVYTHNWSETNNGWVYTNLQRLVLAQMPFLVREIGMAWMEWPHSFTELDWKGYFYETKWPFRKSNRLDIMSSLRPIFGPAWGWRKDLPPPLAINRYSAGWIPPEEVALHITDEGTYTLNKPLEGGKQFLVIHSGRPHAFTTVEVMPERPAAFPIPHSEGVLVSRYDQSRGTYRNTRFGPALHNSSQKNVGMGHDFHSLIVDGSSRNVGGITISASKNSDGSYDVTVSGGRFMEFDPWCPPISGQRVDFKYDKGCLLDRQRARIVSGPTVISDAGDDGTYALGDTITFQIKFSKVVHHGGNLDVPFQMRDETGRESPYPFFRGSLFTFSEEDRAGLRNAPVTSRVNAKTLTFNYTVQRGDYDPDGISTNSFRPGLWSDAMLGINGYVRDSLGEEAILKHKALRPQKKHKVDGIVPAIKSAGPVITSDPDSSGPDDDTYTLGDVITVAVEFDRPMTVDTPSNGADPQLALQFGGATKQAAYSSGSGTKTLTFSYTVATGDTALLGIRIPANALTANDATIKWTDGLNDADLSHRTASFANHKVSSVLPSAVPSQPGAVALTPGNHRAKLTWSAAGSGNASKYQYQVSANGAAWPIDWVDIPFEETVFGGSPLMISYTVPNLTNGNAYKFRLRAVNSQGSGPYQETASLILLPLAPSGLTATDAGGGATLRWDAPDSSHGVERYHYRVGSGSPVKWDEWQGPIPAGVSYVVAGLSGGRYAFQLRAVIPGDGQVNSRQSVPSETVYANLTPGKPQLQGPLGERQGKVLLNFADNDPTVTKYTVRVKTADGAFEATDDFVVRKYSVLESSRVSIAVGGLAMRETYYIKVQAHNIHGGGQESDSVRVRRYDIIFTPAPRRP